MPRPPGRRHGSILPSGGVSWIEAKSSSASSSSPKTRVDVALTASGGRVGAVEGHGSRRQAGGMLQAAELDLEVHGDPLPG